MELRTRFTELYGLSTPIAQAGMAFVAMTPELPVAVSNAGALGGLGVGLLPVDRPTRPGVRVLDLAGTGVVLTAYAATRRGRDAWPPLRLLLDRLRAPGGS